MPLSDFDKVLKTAIRERRLITFVLDQRPRRAEPHDYGLIDGEPRLFFYQVGGESRSGRPVGWRWAVLSKVSELRVLDERFSGPRPAPSGRHVKWDKLFATARLAPVAR
ncbi:MAG TPA: hypothetical protein VNA44_08425 [Burkholderiaceae bacterium]|nr:hypothetical protein [Burkholderiaceae bacterium]